MRRTAAAIGTLAVAGVLAVGCGSDSEPADGDDTTTTGPGITATVPETSTSTTEVDVTDADVEAMLLTTADLGAGWTTDTEPLAGTLSVPSCLDDVEGTGDSLASADATFANGPSVFAFEGLGVQSSAADARDAYEAVTTAFDACTDVSVTLGEQTLSGTIAPTGTNRFGDASEGYTMSFSGGAEPLTIDVVVAQVDEADVIVMYGAVGTPEAGFIDTVAQKAVAKVA